MQLWKFNDSVEWCKDCRKLSDYCKKCDKIHEDYKLYLEYVDVKKTTLILSV